MTVHVIATGGTIASHFDGADWTEIPGRQLVAELGPLPFDVQVHDVASGPSSNLSTADMVAIAERARALLVDGAEGVVVVHGTDTLELTAFVVQLLLGTDPTRRPVVFTGSMRVHSHAAPDGPRNLRDAITVAAHPDAAGREVLVCLNGELHAADRVTKRSAASVDAFHSAPLDPVGWVSGEEVRFRADAGSRPAARGPGVPAPDRGSGRDSDRRHIHRTRTRRNHPAPASFRRLIARLISQADPCRVGFFVFPARRPEPRHHFPEACRPGNASG